MVGKAIQGRRTGEAEGEEEVRRRTGDGQGPAHCVALNRIRTRLAHGRLARVPNPHFPAPEVRASTAAPPAHPTTNTFHAPPPPIPHPLTCTTSRSITTAPFPPLLPPQNTHIHTHALTAPTSPPPFPPPLTHSICSTSRSTTTAPLSPFRPPLPPLPPKHTHALTPPAFPPPLSLTRSAPPAGPPRASGRRPRPGRAAAPGRRGWPSP